MIRRRIRPAEISIAFLLFLNTLLCAERRETHRHGCIESSAGRRAVLRNGARRIRALSLHEIQVGPIMDVCMLLEKSKKREW